MKAKQDAEPIDSSDALYDLFYGGYIKPANYVDTESAEQVEEAVNFIKEFFATLERAGLLEEC